MALKTARRTIGINEFKIWKYGRRLNLSLNVTSGVDDPSLVFEMDEVLYPIYLHSPFSHLR